VSATIVRAGASALSIVIALRVAALTTELPTVPESWDKLNGSMIVFLIVLGAIFLLHKPCNAWAEQIRNSKPPDPTESIREMSKELRRQTEVLNTCFTQEAKILATIEAHAEQILERERAISTNIHEFNRAIFSMLASAIIKDPRAALEMLDSVSQFKWELYT
jgi:hypothetical protein